MTSEVIARKNSRENIGIGWFKNLGCTGTDSQSTRRNADNLGFQKLASFLKGRIVMDSFKSQAV